MRRLPFFAVTLSLLPLLVDCAQKPVEVPIRSLERSGRTALVCLDPGGGTNLSYPLLGCGTRPTHDVGGNMPHVFALVTQTTRGEIAVLDISTNVVVDTDGATPGYNFLPVGAQPTDIVSSPDSSAAFVASAEVNHPGLYAIPTDQILGQRPTIRAWPACSLPAAPGAMSLVLAPDSDARCDAPAVPEPAEPPATTDAHGKLANGGRTKLFVTLPSEGDLLVIDAQALLDRPAGSFDECPIDRRIKLRVDVPAQTTLSGDPIAPVCPPAPAAPEPSSGCPVRPPQVATYGADFSPRPDHLVVEFPSSFLPSDTVRRLFVTDRGAPEVHVLDIHDPCSPSELDPLLPSSFDDPQRPVMTSAAALSPVTSDLKQYLYAVDDDQGSMMVFDVSADSPTRSPVVRPRADLFPYWARDRIALLGAPVKDVLFVTQDYPADNGNGSLPPAVFCDPTAASTDPNGGVFQTLTDFSAGAGPRKLRGTFALAALTNGQVVFIDLDDYDAPCRSYKAPMDGSTTLPSVITGCDASCTTDLTTVATAASSGEGSCRVVERHEVRSYWYFAATTETGQHFPTFQTFPNLTYQGNTLPADNSDQGLLAPKLRGPMPPIPGSMGVWNIAKSGTVVPVQAGPTKADSTQHFVLPDATEPRLAVEQDWSATYEGVIPGFDGKAARLNTSFHGDSDLPLGVAIPPTDPHYVSESRGVFDGNANFCYSGVHDEDSARAEALRLGIDKRTTGDAEFEAFVRDHADWIEITNNLLDENDPYWTTPGNACSFISCRANFGTQDAPTLARSFRILRAYNDHVLTAYQPVNDVTSSDPNAPISPECCFPTLVNYRVRGGATWIVLGSATGFTHHVAPVGPGYQCADLGVEPTTHVECDGTFVPKTGRAYEIDDPLKIDSGASFGDPSVFHNSQMYFAIYRGANPSQRDMQFTWHMTGGFVPLAVGVGRGSSLVSPQELFYHPSLGQQVLVTDGSQQGVVQIDLSVIAVSNVFF